MDQHPIQGGVEIPLGTKCYRNRDKLRSDGPLGSYADLTFTRRVLRRCVGVVLFSLVPRWEYHHHPPTPNICDGLLFLLFTYKSPTVLHFCRYPKWGESEEELSKWKKVKILLPCVFFCMKMLSIFFRMRIASTFKGKRPCTRFFSLRSYNETYQKSRMMKPRISHLISTDCHFSLDFHLIRHSIPMRVPESLTTENYVDMKTRWEKVIWLIKRILGIVN